MSLVTLDTNILPADDVVDAATTAGHECAVSSVSRRELRGTTLEGEARSLPFTREMGIWGKASWGEAVYASARSSDAFRRILNVISSGAFPEDWNGLTPKQENQLSDALMLESHIREKREIFVTNDERGFVRHGKRETLEREFEIRIMTKPEFLTFCGCPPAV